LNIKTLFNIKISSEYTGKADLKIKSVFKNPNISEPKTLNEKFSLCRDIR